MAQAAAHLGGAHHRKLFLRIKYSAGIEMAREVLLKGKVDLLVLTSLDNKLLYILKMLFTLF